MRIIFLLFALATFSNMYAHVGSPEVVMEGKAGPYNLLVSVKPPDVIPGVAKVTIYMQSQGAAALTLRAVYFRSGDEGAPEPDLMVSVAGTKGQYTGETWFMNGGSASVQINVNGALGKGEMIVPVVAISTAKKQMPASTGWVLAALGLFLFVLMITIIGSAVSDALTKKGELLNVRRKRIRIAGIAVAAVFTSIIVYGGNSWWRNWADDYNRFMYKPIQAVTAITQQNGANELRFTLDTNSQRKNSYSFVVPDHGKMMHMFIMRIPAMDAFAHLHPERVDSAQFRTLLPVLPAGKYLAFADIVYLSGFTETIKDTFEIKNLPGNNSRKLDQDDAFAFAIPADVIDNPQLTDPENTIICGKPGTGVKLKDGSTMIWEQMTNKPLEAGKLYDMQFTVLDVNKQPAKLDPYLGMSGHAAVIRNDGNVYVHLHPVGTFSMAAETNLVKRIGEPQGLYTYPNAKQFRDSVDKVMQNFSVLPDSVKNVLLMQGMDMNKSSGSEMEGMKHENGISFPYAFPSPGQYRIWVQVKRNGQILTGAFDKQVE